MSLPNLGRYRAVSDSLKIIEDDLIENKNFRPIRLLTCRGEVTCRYYPADSQRGVICVGGDWDSPAQKLYPQLCTKMKNNNIHALRIKFRQSTNLNQTVFDIFAGISYLETQGIKHLALVGHSLGAAAVIQAAALSPIVRTVITLGTQTYGIDYITQLGPRCSILLLHGKEDIVLPASCSQYAYQIAKRPKKLILYRNTGHCLDEVASQVFQTTYDWILNWLNPKPSAENFLPPI